MADFEELLQKRRYADYRGYIKLVEVMHGLNEEDQEEVREIQKDREELNDQLLTLLTCGAGGNAH